MDFRQEHIARQLRMGIRSYEMPVVSRKAVRLSTPKPVEREVIAVPVVRDVLHLATPEVSVVLNQAFLFRLGLAARAFARGAFAAFAEDDPEFMKISAIISMVSRISGVSIGEIKSDRRNPGVIRPRMVAAWACRHWSSKSFPEIGMAIGRRDHTTAMHSVAVVDHLARRLGVHPDDNKQTAITVLVSASEQDWQWAKNARNAEKVTP
jgi:hypothetical protein